MLLTFKFFNYCILLTNFIFIGGLFTMISSKNTLIWLLGLEMLIISSFLNFSIYANTFLAVEGYIYSLALLLFGACETALGLSIIILNAKIAKNYTNKGDIFDLYHLKNQF